MNAVVLWPDTDKQAWIVDPGGDAAWIGNCLRRHGLQVALYVCTHGHIDHISALDALLAVHPAPVWLHAEDAKWAFSLLNRLPPHYPEAPHRPLSIQTAITDGMMLAAGGLEAKVILTPGHTPGGICLYFAHEKLLLSGDTLFAGSVGRTDLAGGDRRTLKRSLAKLMTLPDDTQVIPGHAQSTTIGLERQTNPHLR